GTAAEGGHGMRARTDPRGGGGRGAALLRNAHATRRHAVSVRSDRQLAGRGAVALERERVRPGHLDAEETDSACAISGRRTHTPPAYSTNASERNQGVPSGIARELRER